MRLGILSFLSDLLLKIVSILRRAHVSGFSSRMFSRLRKPQRYIVTGPPGSGKTSLILALEKQYGYSVIREAATDIISLGFAQGLEKPWQASDFDAKILELQIKRFKQHKDAGITLCDRSPIDIYAYSEFHQTPLPHGIDEYVTTIIKDPSFSKTLLFTENFGYMQNTATRPESLEQALELDVLLTKYYERFGFTIVRIPPLPIRERIDYVRELLSNLEHRGSG